MQTDYATQIQTGTDVIGSDGEKIGDVAGVANTYFVIEKGFFFPTDIYVPMSAVSSLDEDGIRLSLTKDEIENGDYTTKPADDSYGDGGESAYAARTSAGHDADEDVLERREERLTVDKQTQKAGEVRVGKRVVEEQQAVDVPVSREEVSIQRREVDRPASGEAFTEESIDVPVYEERVEAGKEARVVEELEVDKTATTGTARVHDTVRREEFEIEADDDLASDSDAGSRTNR
jgi:uncharacterized protein (TIGR02271 family)